MGQKSNKKVLVGMWVIVCVQKPSHHFLQTFRPLRMFEIVLRDNSLSSLSETILLILSAKAYQRKRWLHY